MKLKKLMKLNQAGFGHFEAVIAVAVIVMVGAVGVYVSQRNHSHAATEPLIIYNNGSVANDYQIYTASTKAVVTNTHVVGSYPVWGENSSVIFYTNKKDQAIFTMSPTGSNSTQIIPPIGSDVIDGITWSEAAQKLAIVVSPEQHEGPWVLYTANADGSNLTDINTKSGLSSILNATWSPNGKKLLITNVSSKYSVDVINSDGSNLVKVIKSAPALGDNPWSSDSSQITYIGFANGVDTLNTVDANGKDPQSLASSPSNSTIWNSATWSPDGSKIAFYQFEAGKSNLEVLNVSTKAIQQSSTLSNSEGLGGIDWSPDSKYLATYNILSGYSTSDLYTLNVSSNTLNKITTMDSLEEINNALDWSIQ